MVRVYLRQCKQLGRREIFIFLKESMRSVCHLTAEWTKTYGITKYFVWEAEKNWLCQGAGYLKSEAFMDLEKAWAI